MKLSARNILKGKIVEAKKGQTTADVRIDLGGGSIVTALITNEAVDELKLGGRPIGLRRDQRPPMSRPPSILQLISLSGARPRSRCSHPALKFGWLSPVGAAKNR